MDYTIQNVLIAVDDGYDTTDIQIVKGRIAAIAPQLQPIGTVIDATNKLVLPGFVNAHTHSSEMWQRGLIGPLPLELWLAELYDFAPLDPEQIYLSALGTAVETLLSGGTTVVDHLVLIPGQELATIEAAVRAYREVGIRAFVGPLIQDEAMTRGIPSGDTPQTHAPFAQSTQDVLTMMQDAIARFHAPEDNIHIMVAPTGTQLCSDELFKGCIALSDRYDLRRHAHLLETKAQQMLAYEKYGCSAVEYLNKIGFLGPRTSLAHCVWLNDDDIEIMAATQSTAVHNPLSNLRLGSGIAPVLKYRQAGVNVTFGCDGTASSDGQDLLEVIKVGTMIHNTTDFEYRQWIKPREAIQMASLGGAKGLDQADSRGQLEVGQQADLVLYDLMDLSLLPRTDPIGLLVMGSPRQVVDSVWVNGRQVVANKQVQTIDVSHLKQAMFEQSQWQIERSSPSKNSVEPQYRRVMRLSS